MVQIMRRQSINEEDSGMECIPSKTEGKIGLSQQGETNVNYMSMFSLYFAILMMNMWTWMPKMNTITS